MKRILSILLLACLYFNAKSQATYLDSSFNATGIVSLNHTGARDFPNVSLTRPNGKSLEIGYAYFDTRTPAATLTTVTAVQFDTFGNPDPAFGQNGIVVLDQLKTDAEAADAVLLPDGKLLITGKYLNSNSGPHHFIVRLNEDGSVDTAFGVDGVAGHPDPDLVAWGTAVAVQPDGKILMGGSRFTFIPPGDGYFEAAMIRFNADGSVDYGFGNNGIVVCDFTPDVQGIAFGAGNTIYTGGARSAHALLVRYLPDGAVDSTFGLDGSVQLPDFGGLRYVLMQPDGRIVVAGPKKNWNYKAFIRRLNADGSSDPSFENAEIPGGAYLSGIAVRPDGKIAVGTFDGLELRVFVYGPEGQLDTNFDKTIPLSPKYAFNRGLSWQPDGKIILAGTRDDDFLYKDFCLLRLTETLGIDSTYGVNGFAVQNLGTNRSTANSVLIDGQNRILVGGDATYNDNTTISNMPLVNSVGFVSRFQPDGSLDNTFSADGFIGLPKYPAILNLIVRQPDGKILSAGGSPVTTTYTNFGVARLFPDGAPDTTFGPYGDGFAERILDWDVYNAYAGAVALAPDSAIVVMGKVIDAADKRKIALVRFTPDGWPDPLFGMDGLLTHEIIPGNFQLNAGLVQPDGKILVGGTYGAVPNIFLVRFGSDGAPDSSFGTGGVVLKPFAGVSYRLNALALQADGQILLSGNQGANNNVMVGRLNPDGTKDETFSDDGLVVLNTGQVESGNALAVQANGKIVVAGFSGISGAAASFNPLIFRLLADGAPDSSFAGTAYLVTDLPGDNQLKALAIQPDGSYIAAGYSGNDYLLIRYLSHLTVGLVDAPAFTQEVLVYPNPLQGRATFTYTLPAPSRVTLDLFDMQGKRCHSFLLDENRPAGENTEYLYFPQTLTPGVYTLRVGSEKGSRSVKVLVVR